MEDREKTREELIEEVESLRRRTTGLQEELKQTKEELDIQLWGVAKTNDAIKVLYKELEKKNMELRELDKLKSDFINTVSHELRTPLTTIREAISQVQDGILGETTARQREFLSLCLEDTDRLKRIIDDLLDVSKLEAGKFTIVREEVDIVELAKRVITVFEPKAVSKNLEIKEKFSNEKSLAYVDRDSIIRVFTNLIGNAIKFTDKGYIEISVIDKNEWVECTVSDTGRGISEEDLPKVFSKFQQFGRTDGPAEKGTGLGLSICKSIVELHQGKIWVDSLLNQGTKFTFTLPKFEIHQNKAISNPDFPEQGIKEIGKTED